MKNPGISNRLAAGGDAGPKLMLVVLSLIWGCTWPAMKIALGEIPPFGMRTITAGLGATTLYLLCLIQRRPLKVRNFKAWGHIAIASVLNIVGFTVLSSLAQLATTTSRVAILSYTMPIWAALLAWPVLGERPIGVKAVALFLCAAGLAVLVYPLTKTGLPLGVMLAIATGASWGAGTVYLKWARIEADPMAAAAWQLIVAFGVIFACMLIFEGGIELARAHADALFAVAFTGIVGNGVAYALWFTVVGRVPATTASLGVLSSPVIGIVSSVAILGEVPTGTDILGFTLIFAASACVLLPGTAGRV